MVATLTASTACIKKAGANADATITADDTTITAWIEQEEGRVEAETRRTWVANFSDLSTPIKNILDDVVSSGVAKRIIAYNPDGFETAEFDTLMNLNTDIEKGGIVVLKDKNSNTLLTP